jgi:membrane-bound lytic murein transglycosylase
MRKALLTLGLVVLLAIPASAQFGLPVDATMLLSNKGVQDELKLSDEQKKSIKEANDDFAKALQKAREDMDFSGLATARQDQVKAIKKVHDKLDEKQAKRLAQIEFQQVTKGKMKNPRILANTHIQKALKLTDEQKKTVKDTITELDKDFKELDDEAKDDFQKQFANFRKKAELNNEAYEKIVKKLDDDQKKDFDKAGGEKFTLKVDFPFGKDKKKDDKKDDQF